MPHQPTHPHPYLETIEGASIKQKVFSVIINPKDIIEKAQVKIFKVSDESLVLQSNLETFATPYYGNEELSVVFKDTELTDGENYKWQIILHGADGDSITTPFYHFSVRTKPSIAFEVIPDVITSCEYTFKANYFQEQNESYMYYVYKLYRESDVIDSTDELMSSALTYSYDGFVSGYSYRIELMVVMADKRSYTISKSFSVKYERQPSYMFSTVFADKKQNCISVDFSQNISVKGNTTDIVQYSSFVDSVCDGAKYLQIPDASCVYYEKVNESKELDLGEHFTLYYSVHFSELFSGDIITLTDNKTGSTYNVRYDSKKFYYRIGDNSEVSIDPYINQDGIHQEMSVVHDSMSNVNDINTDTLYMLYGDDLVTEDCKILYNDITNEFWWIFAVTDTFVRVFKGRKYAGSVVV